MTPRVQAVTWRVIASDVSRLCTTFTVQLVVALQSEHDKFSVEAFCCYLFYFLDSCHSNCSHRGWPNVDCKLILCLAMLALRVSCFDLFCFG